jgi:hypothetical protein
MGLRQHGSGGLGVEALGNKTRWGGENAGAPSRAERRPWAPQWREVEATTAGDQPLSSQSFREKLSRTVARAATILSVRLGSFGCSFEWWTAQLRREPCGSGGSAAGHPLPITSAPHEETTCLRPNLPFDCIILAHHELPVRRFRARYASEKKWSTHAHPHQD